MLKFFTFWQYNHILTRGLCITQKIKYINFYQTSLSCSVILELHSCNYSKLWSSFPKMDKMISFLSSSGQSLQPQMNVFLSVQYEISYRFAAQLFILELMKTGSDRWPAAVVQNYHHWQRRRPNTLKGRMCRCEGMTLDVKRSGGRSRRTPELNYLLQISMQ